MTDLSEASLYRFALSPVARRQCAGAAQRPGRRRRRLLHPARRRVAPRIPTRRLKRDSPVDALDLGRGLSTSRSRAHSEGSADAATTFTACAVAETRLPSRRSRSGWVFGRHRGLLAVAPPRRGWRTGRLPRPQRPAPLVQFHRERDAERKRDQNRPRPGRDRLRAQNAAQCG